MPDGRRFDVRLSIARHRRRPRDYGRFDDRIGRAPDVLKGRFSGHARIVHSWPSGYTDRDRPHGGRPRRLRADVHCRSHRDGRRRGRLVDGNRGRSGLSVSGRDCCGRLSVHRRRRGRRTTKALFAAKFADGRRVIRRLVRHGGRACRYGRHGGQRRHADVPAHRHTVDANLFGGNYGPAPVR